MSFQSPPSLQDIEGMALDCLPLLPLDLGEEIRSLTIIVDDFPSDEMEAAFELEDSFELLALYRDHEEKIPGVESKGGNGEPILFLFRRPILDHWCETEDDLAQLIQHVMINELALAKGFSEPEAEALALTNRAA